MKCPSVDGISTTTKATLFHIPYGTNEWLIKQQETTKVPLYSANKFHNSLVGKVLITELPTKLILTVELTHIRTHQHFQSAHSLRGWSLNLPQSVHKGHGTSSLTSRALQ